MELKVAVIGAGISGLAAAIRLRAKGHQVSVFEANDYPGGKLAELNSKGYRFDAGPSLFTMPQYIEELFDVAGYDMNQYFSYRQLDVSCHYFYPDGTFIKAWSDTKQLANEIEEKLGVPAATTSRYFRQSQKVFELTTPVFLERSLHRIQSYVSTDVLKALLHVFRLGLFHTLHQLNKKRLKHPKLVQFFNRYATYNGSNPYQAPGVLQVIPHLEHGYGTYFPEGGMHAITKAMYKLAQDMGVSFYFKCPVKEITYTNAGERKVNGIKAGGETLSFDRVVSNSDVVTTYRKLLPHVKAPEKTLNQERSSSALIFYWGVRRQFDQLDLHNILFSGDYAGEFNAIFNRKTIIDDPTVYINITSKYQPEDAPEGGENWFVMINVPHDSGQDWDALIQQARQHIVQKINLHLQTDIAPLIETEELLDPRKMASRTGSYLGALYGASSNNRFSAFLRHPNFSGDIKGLYFCGGSVHPGGGIPLCLLSAKIVADAFK